MINNDIGVNLAAISTYHSDAFAFIKKTIVMLLHISFCLKEWKEKMVSKKLQAIHMGS